MPDKSHGPDSRDNTPESPEVPKAKKVMRYSALIACAAIWWLAGLYLYLSPNLPKENALRNITLRNIRLTDPFPTFGPFYIYGAMRDVTFANITVTSFSTITDVLTEMLSAELLAAAGVRRIVSPQRFDSSDCAASAAALGIEVCVVLDTPARASFREQLGSANEDMERVRALREERKRLRKEHKFGRKTIRSDGQELATAEEQASDPSMVE